VEPNALPAAIGRTFSNGCASRRGAGAALFARLLFALLLLGAPLGVTPADAQEPVEYSGIVIRPGDGTVTYVYVPLEDSVSGIELLRRSGVSLLTVGFGGLGDGVCQIEETGCDVGPCRTRLCQTGDRESPYWRYFQRDDSGNWVASPLGGSVTKIEPGEVDGWSWTPDDPKLPDVEIGAIPALAHATGNPDDAHFVRYDANGNVMTRDGSLVVPLRQYAVVGVVLAAIAVFALFLRFRPQGRV
jgi:hypothetical protein